MSLKIVEIPEAPDRPGKEFDDAVKERLTFAHAVKLSSFTVQDLEALTPRLYEGYLVHCSNGDTGNGCLAYCDGFNWKVVSISSNISIT